MSIDKLIKKYESNRDYYLSSKYNETQLRTDFLDPFFELLGWDIKNSQGKPFNEREVLLEESLKENASSNSKKPDYTFRLFNERKFFLEAKKPSVRIDNDAEPAKQVRQYGFTAKLKISVLSNFEYLAIYDCSHQVEDDDTTSTARINLYHYTEYVNSFETIINQLGKQAVYTGDFDTLWIDIEEQLMRFSIDELFLEQINRWRLLLGQEIHSHKPEFNNTYLNDLVQSYLNSIIFLRVCEDRDLEVYKTLLEYATNKDYQALIDKFIGADRKYNAGLFSHDMVEDVIKDNSSVFWTIIQELYQPKSKYSFSVFASDILGSIYEIFLAEQLVINGNEVILEKKPDNVDRDIVTTPTFIVGDILRHTILPFCEGKNDAQILDIRIADIACGSGVFLLEAYQLINDILIDYYLLNDQSKVKQIGVNMYKLSFETKRTIIENCIFGVDKDFSAVEACKFGLLLKLLEDESTSSVSTPALPDLTTNIQFGNSLIESVQVAAIETQDINPFDFPEEKFDLIIGNPPYLKTEDMKNLTPFEFNVYKKHYESAYKQFDKYFLFVERSINLLKKGGYLGYIVPNKFTKVDAGKKLRKLLKDRCLVDTIISFGAQQVFKDKSTYTCLLFIRNELVTRFKYVEVSNLSEWKVRDFTNDSFDSIDIKTLEDDVWILVPKDLQDVYESILKQSITLESLLGSKAISNGIQTSANDVYIHILTKEDDNYYYFIESGTEWKVERELTRPYFKTFNNEKRLNTYRPLKPNSFVIYPYLNEDNKIVCVDIETMKHSYPAMYMYLKTHEERLRRRSMSPKLKNDDEWYRYGRHQSLDKCDVPIKIVVGVNSQGGKYAIDEQRTFVSSGGTAGYVPITLPYNSRYSIYYLQAILSSKYIEWVASLIGEFFRGGYVARGTKVLKRLPIRKIDFENKIEWEFHQQISKTQQELMVLQREIDSSRGNNRILVQLDRQFKSKEIGLEEMIATLYQLGDRDLAVPIISELYETNKKHK